MNNKLKTERMDALINAVLSLSSEEECYNFFEDLCTVSELMSMEQRFAVARMLTSGHQYAEIVAETGASTATISRVNRALMYGADGYRKVIEKIDNKKE